MTGTLDDVFDGKLSRNRRRRSTAYPFERRTYSYPPFLGVRKPLGGDSD